MSIDDLGRVFWLAVLLGSGCTQTAAAPDVSPQSTALELRERSFEFDVVLRETGSATIHARVFTPCARSRGATLLAVPGLSETAAMFEPLAQAIFQDRRLGRQIGRIVAIDLVGRGESSLPRDLPDGARFGELTIEDNVATVIQSLAALRERGYPASILLGHSMGGLAVLSVQQQLLSKATSLAEAGVRRAILLAPVPPHARPWVMGPVPDLTPFVKQSDELGSYFASSAELWIAQAFSTTSGTLVPNTPTPEELVERGYMALEPLATVLQVIEQPITLPDGSTITVPRPFVDAGSFAPEHGTQLSLLGFAEDVLIPPQTLGNLYSYLTGQPEHTGYIEVDTDDAVHNALVSNPSLITRALRSH